MTTDTTASSLTSLATIQAKRRTANADDGQKNIGAAKGAEKDWAAKFASCDRSERPINRVTQLVALRYRSGQACQSTEVWQ